MPTNVERTVLTVSQLTHQIKNSLEHTFPRVWLSGELSNVKLHTSGHLYYTLKDEGAQISGVMWRSRVAGVRLSLEDGMKVLVRGSVTVYPPRGAYQVDTDSIQPLGLGELQRRFEELKNKLEKQGLFDAARKRPLPEYPSTIGIVTSETGAALHDILSVLSRRMPSVEVILCPARVQGVGAAEEIAGAIETMNRRTSADVLIVGRGGGSLEDLWAFNEEVVARAIASSAIPVVSAVGHEVDVTIADLVADLRAATPSIAAERVVRDRSDVLELLSNLWYTATRRVQERTRAQRDRLRMLRESYALNRPKDLLREYVQRLDEHERRLRSACRGGIQREAARLKALSARLNALGPHEVLKRGYAIVRADGIVRSRAAQVPTSSELEVEFYDGRLKVNGRRST